MAESKVDNKDVEKAILKIQKVERGKQDRIKLAEKMEGSAKSTLRHPEFFCKHPFAPLKVPYFEAGHLYCSHECYLSIIAHKGEEAMAKAKAMRSVPEKKHAVTHVI